MCFVGIVGFIFAQAKIFLVSVLFFCLLNSIDVLQAKKVLGLELQWFLFFFLKL